MVVLAVNQICVLLLKTKGQAPVAVDRDGPVVEQTALERMQLPARIIHIFGGLSAIQHAELQTQSYGVLRLNPDLRSGAVELLQPLVGEAPDHVISVSPDDTDVYRRLFGFESERGLKVALHSAPLGREMFWGAFPGLRCASPGSEFRLSLRDGIARKAHTVTLERLQESFQGLEMGGVDLCAVDIARNLGPSQNTSQILLL